MRCRGVPQDEDHVGGYRYNIWHHPNPCFVCIPGVGPKNKEAAGLCLTLLATPRAEVSFLRGADVVESRVHHREEPRQSKGLLAAQD